MLTATDVRRLTLWKWKYTAESAGFTSQEAARLVFWRWYARNRLAKGGK